MAGRVLLACLLVMVAIFVGLSLWPLSEGFPRLPTRSDYLAILREGWRPRWPTAWDLLERLATCTPIGVLLTLFLSHLGWRRAVPAAAAMLALLFASVEFAQPLFWRHSRLNDLVEALVLGWVGVALAQVLWRRQSLAALQSLAIALNLIAVACVGVSHHGLSLRHWNCDFPLVVGDEPSGGRPWQGSLRHLAIYDRALAPEAQTKVPAIASFQAGDLDNGTAPLPQGAAICAAIAKSGEMTLAITLATATAEQRGPARIVTQSYGPYSRNFTLGQSGESLVLRLRSPRNGNNGMLIEVRRTASFADGEDHRVVASYRAGTAKLWLDGRRLTPAEQFHATLVLGEAFHVPLAIALGALLLATGLLQGSGKRRNRTQRILWVATAAAVPLSAALLQTTQGLAILPGVLATALLAPFGGLLIARALRRRR